MCKRTGREGGEQDESRAHASLLSVILPSLVFPEPSDGARPCAKAMSSFNHSYNPTRLGYYHRHLNVRKQAHTQREGRVLGPAPGRVSAQACGSSTRSVIPPGRVGVVSLRRAGAVGKVWKAGLRWLEMVLFENHSPLLIIGGEQVLLGTNRQIREEECCHSLLVQSFKVS